jgi:hypothetical protein
MKEFTLTLIHESEIWVRKGERYPAGAVRVLVVEGDLVDFSPEGGGFVYQTPRVKFLSDFEPAPTKAPEWQHGLFVIDGIEGRFPGWTQGFRWNGWATPSFERATVHAICAAADIPWRDGSDQSITIYPDGADPMELLPAFLECDGASRTLYAFDGWCWLEGE